MQSTLTAQDTDPHDAFVIEPDVVLATRAASPDPVQELLSHLAHQSAQKPPQASSPVSSQASPEVSVAAPTPTVDTTFRAAAVDATNVRVAPEDGSGIGWWVKRAFVAFMFALCSAFAAAAWTHHGAAAKQMISSWLPPFVLAALPLEDKPLTDTPPAAEQPDSTPVQAADPAPAQPPSAAQPTDAAAAPAATATPAIAAATPAASAAPATATAAPATATAALESTSSTQSMARDLKTMGQQIEQLKASIEQLKASQAQMSREIAKNSEPGPRPRAAAFPPRPVAAIPPRPIPAHRPRQAYAPPPAAIASTLPPPSYAAPPGPPPPLPQSAVSQPAPLPEASDPSDGGPVVRPPMPLR